MLTCRFILFIIFIPDNFILPHADFETRAKLHANPRIIVLLPAKRIKFGELGTWNVEEIRAVGDRITVTVNGEVILDGDIREACQGHNVSEDGSKKNPYTVDHRNHPGLFNKKGHIGLLGHGAGIQFRNIRIKSLDAKTQRSEERRVGKECRSRWSPYH